MHIKFISPKMHAGLAYSPLKFKLVPPQGLLLLAALTPEPHTCELVDENIHQCNHQDNPDFVAISVYVDTANRAYRLADIYRKRGIPVVMGGLHVTACPDTAQQHADAIVVGKADELWPQIISDLENGRLEPIYTNRERVSLDHTPLPKRDLICLADYASVHTMRTSRGCPNRCKFCYQTSFYALPRVRHKPLANIVRQIQAMRARHILFLDDNLFGDKRFARALFTAIEPLKITWSGAATANIGDDLDLLALARASGCKSLFVGFESLSDDNLEANHKVLNQPHHYKAQVTNIHSQGIMINGSFIFGFDHDTLDVFAKTVDWIVKVGVETANFHILTPSPGTPLFAQMEANGRIIDYNWNHYNTTQAVFQPKHMSPSELEQGYLWARKSVYGWKNILARAPKSGASTLAFWAFMLGCKKFAPVTSLMSRMGLLNQVFELGFRNLLKMLVGIFCMRERSQVFCDLYY